jgi:hypothetical protein
MRNLPSLLVLVFLGLLSAHGQDYIPPSFFVRPNQQVALDNLHLRTAARPGPAATIAAALETVFDNPKVCCGEGSAFSEIPDLSGHPSLPEIGNKLSGTRTLGDGRQVKISARYRPGTNVTSFELVTLLSQGQRMLVQWNGRVYVLRGVTFDDDVYSDGHHDYILRKLLLLDPSLKTTSREAAFDRSKDDWSKIDGFLLLNVS